MGGLNRCEKSRFTSLKIRRPALFMIWTRNIATRNIATRNIAIYLVGAEDGIMWA